jgi:phosphohistidine phosphatase
MTRTLVVLRHAKSDWSAPVADRERPLAERGRRQAPQAGAWLGAWLEGAGLVLDRALVSPARRTRETWERAAAAAGPAVADGPVSLEEDAYTFDGEDLLALVRVLDASTVALVGHNPAVEELVALLTGDRVAMPTSCLAVVALDDWAAAGDGRALLLAHGRPPGEPATRPVP